jgi:hypothetical protein
MPALPSWIMGFFIFGAIRYATGIYLPGGSVGEQLIAYVIPLVGALMVVGLVGRIFLPTR